jgi:hypothetical protein
MGSTPMDPQTNFAKPLTNGWVPRGSISFAHLYATCPTSIHPHVCLGVCLVTCHCTCHLWHVSYSCTTLPRQSYGRATCHPYSGDTCHTLIVHMYLSMSTSTVPYHVNRTTCTFSYHVALYGLYSYQIFAYLEK